MGYYVNTGDCNIVVKAANAEPALAELIKFNDENDALKRGGSHGPEGKTESWFSWMPKDFRDFKTFGEFLGGLGFNFEVLENGDFVLTHYSDKTGQEDILIEAIARFVEDGSYAEWHGEDGERWRWEFSDGRMIVRDGILSWSDRTYTPTEVHKDLEAELAAIRKFIGEVK